MLQRLAMLGILLASLLTLTASVDSSNRLAFACSCAGPEPADQALAESKAVFSGKVEDIVAVEGQYNKVIMFTLDKIWKGVTEDKTQVTLVTAHDSVACGYHFDIGKSYLVYSYRGSADNSSFSVSLCSSTKPIEQAEADLAILGAGYIPRVSTGNSKSIDVNVGNKTYPLFYNMTNGGYIESAEAQSYQHSGGNLILYLNATRDGVLDITFQREFYDIMGFTDHNVEEIPIFVDELFVMPANASVSCDKIAVRIPIEAGADKVEFVTSDILGAHTHQYPPLLHFTKRIVVVEEGKEFDIRLSSDALRCDVVFSKEEKKLHIDIEDRNNTEGSFKIVIPRQLLGGEYAVTVDGKPASNLQIFTTTLGSFDGTDPNTSTISFNYGANAKSIDIVGTTVIPEFGAVPIVIAALSIATVLIMSSRKLQWK